MEGNVSVHQVNPVSRITGEGGAGGRSFEGRGALVLIKSERGWRGGGRGGIPSFACAVHPHALSPSCFVWPKIYELFVFN